jgi:hypothetical protein
MATLVNQPAAQDAARLVQGTIPLSPLAASTPAEIPILAPPRISSSSQPGDPAINPLQAGATQDTYSAESPLPL